MESIILCNDRENYENTMINCIRIIIQLNAQLYNILPQTRCTVSKFSRNPTNSSTLSKKTRYKSGNCKKFIWHETKRYTMQRKMFNRVTPSMKHIFSNRTLPPCVMSVWKWKKKRNSRMRHDKYSLYKQQETAVKYFTYISFIQILLLLRLLLLFSSVYHGAYTRWCFARVAVCCNLILHFVPFVYYVRMWRV